MKKNVGSYDAGIRFIVGLLVMWWGAHHTNLWGLIGILPVTTAAFAFCPLYWPLHVDTTFTDHTHYHG